AGQRGAEGLPHLEVATDAHEEEQRRPLAEQLDPQPVAPQLDAPLLALGRHRRRRHDQATAPKRARSTFLSNLPTAVFGTSSMTPRRSGSCQRATPAPPRWSRTPATVTTWPGLGPPQARGRSCHFGSGTATTAASATSGIAMIAAS